MNRHFTKGNEIKFLLRRWVQSPDHFKGFSRFVYPWHVIRINPIYKWHPRIVRVMWIYAFHFMINLYQKRWEWFCIFILLPFTIDPMANSFPLTIAFLHFLADISTRRRILIIMSLGKQNRVLTVYKLRQI